MLQSILAALLVTGVLGAFLGLGLVVASRLFAVKKDERIEEATELLPGINCGACGFAGCSAYATGVVRDGAPIDLCSPGGSEVRAKLGALMGVEVSGDTRKMVTQVHCRGGAGTTEMRFRYEGLSDCNALYSLFAGDLACKEGCLGEGSCIRVCPVDAIGYDDEGKVWVDKDACISCGKCIDVCPTGVMRWIPYDADYIVACNNHDKGAAVRKYCGVGCIACKICEKKSPEGGYVVDQNLSTIDYAQQGDRSAGAEKCPPKCIVTNPVKDTRPQALRTRDELARTP